MSGRGDAERGRVPSPALAGAAAGLVNGLFGGGGGMVLLPALEWRVSERERYPTCVAVMFPVCALSSAVYLIRGAVSPGEAAPYLIGGLFGGVLGGRLYGRVPTLWLRRIFAVSLLWAGARYLMG